MQQGYASYAEMFRQATGHDPYPYQARIGEALKLPEVVDIPPGYGKTAAIVLAWLWHRHFHPDDAVRTCTPRRLAIALPMRTLSAQTLTAIRQWLEALGLSAEIGLDELVGGMSDQSRPWRSQPHRSQVIVGTIDMIVSRTLMRGYGSTRATYPIDAALMWNDCHIVVDEVQLAPSATVTARQVSAFQAAFGSLRSGLTCMSATIDRELLRTVDNPALADTGVVTLSEDDATEALERRRTALRRIRELPIDPAKPAQLATAVAERHRTGLTLVIVNTVATATDVYARLSKLKLSTPITLLHSRFRPIDRAQRIAEMLGDTEDRIVVSTQVVEAGMDLDARTLITEAAPWPSIVQRSGRCNRAGVTNDAELWWFAPAKRGPYPAEDLTSSAEQLRSLEDTDLTNEDLLGRKVDSAERELQTLRRDDFLSLFDTTPDLTGTDLDISPYIRDTESLDAQIVWLDLGDDRRPDEELRLPPPEYRCRVPLGAVAELVADGVRVWYFEQVEGRWRTLNYGRRARPGEVLVLDAQEGRYRTSTGFDGKCRVPFTDHATPSGDPRRLADRESDPEGDVLGSELKSIDASGWVPLDDHLRETAEAAEELVRDLGLDTRLATDVVLAAHLHDLGKAHPVWQNALRGTAAGGDGPVPWAKSPGSGRLRYGNGITTFRHEVASVALLDGPFAALLSPAHDPDLVRYLIAAHHGKARVQIRNPADAPPGTLMGLTDGEVIETLAVLGRPAQESTVRLGGLQTHSADGTPAWEDTVTGLLDRYGVFRLAYFEMLVRIADWRSSQLHSGEATK